MNDKAFMEKLKADGRIYYMVGVTKEGKENRASENLTLEQCKNWDAGILKSWYEKFKIVKDSEL